MAIVSTVSMSDVERTTYDTAAFFGFRPANMFRETGVEVRYDVSGDPKRGNAVTFTTINKLAGNTTPLPETSDITPSSMGDTQTTVTLNEFGDVVQTSEKFRVTAFIDTNVMVMGEVGRAMGEAMDILCRTNGFDQATNLLFPSTATSDNTVPSGSTGKILGAIAAKPRALLASNAVPASMGAQYGMNYKAVIHPCVTYDLTGETGGRGWRDPHIYGQDQGGIFTGEIGLFEGSRYVENSRAKVNTAATNCNVYSTYYYGAQAVAEARGTEPEVRLTGPFDALARFLNTGWYALISWGILRQGSLYVVRTNSSIDPAGRS